MNNNCLFFFSKKLKSVDSLCALSVSARGSQIMLISVVWIVLTIATLLKTHYIGGCGFKGQNWNHLLFWFVCFCTQSPFPLCQSRSARCSISNGSIFLRTPRDMEKTRCDWSFSIQIHFLLWSNWTHLGPGNNVPWLVTIIQICFLLWSRSQRPRDLQISPYDWSELFQICALFWQGWRRMFSTASLRTLENHSERCIKLAFFSFITKSSSTAKLRLPSSS